MIVVTVIVIIAAIAIPNLLAARVRANETSAIATLRTVSSAQMQFQTATRVDVDFDGSGEFGLFRELSGRIGVRTTATADLTGNLVQPPALSNAFQNYNANSEVSHSGYLFRMYLPGAGGAGVAEVAAGALPAPLESDLAETTWVCYAWPSSRATTGNRAFFVNTTGDILASEDVVYSATGAITSTNCGAAFRAGTGLLDHITGVPAVGTVGRDGGMWRQGS